MHGEDLVGIYFSKKPELRPLFDALAQKISNIYPDTVVKVQKTQISFCGPKPFCWAWIPIRNGIKGRPEQYLIVSFGLNREIIHPRLIDTAQPYPNRWTHHTIISNSDDIDAQLMGWIGQAHCWKNVPAVGD